MADDRQPPDFTGGTASGRVGGYLVVGDGDDGFTRVSRGKGVADSRRRSHFRRVSICVLSMVRSYALRRAFNGRGAEA